MTELSLPQVETILQESIQSFPHAACRTCECFLGLVAQLSSDSGADGRGLLGQYKPEQRKIHACLGCDPCPPGNKFAHYIKQKQQKKLITV
jgi:hypothetical protein